MTHLMGLVEEEAEVGEDHPELLPTVTVLKLPQQVTRQLVLETHRDESNSLKRHKYMFYAGTV